MTASGRCSVARVSRQGSLRSRNHDGMREEALAGGNVADEVVRVGDTVRKPWNDATPAVHAYLRHVAVTGLAPTVLGRDEQGRQMLEYVISHLRERQDQVDRPLQIAFERTRETLAGMAHRQQAHLKFCNVRRMKVRS